jgi:hypothetical protein
LEDCGLVLIGKDHASCSVFVLAPFDLNQCQEVEIWCAKEGSKTAEVEDGRSTHYRQLVDVPAQTPSQQNTVRPE